MSKSTRDKNPQDSENLNGVRPGRQKGRRSREERGLPEQAARRDLARTYLELQNQFWCKIPAVRQQLPAATEENVERLAEEFKQRFLAKEIDLPLCNIARSKGVGDVGGAYLRYSCDNSNPRSLDQQLRNALERASRDHVFLPWDLVFADAAVTGTTAARRGYQMAKAAVIRSSSPLQRLYIDEIGRAARDAIEALSLGRLIDGHRKQLIGVTDGFDSAQPHSKMLLTLNAMLHEWFVDQLRAKVKRGMEDAFLQGRNITPPSFGYKLEPMTDSLGNPVYDQEGLPIQTKVIDTDEIAFVVEIFKLYAEHRWSPGKIAKNFNDRNVGGRKSWGSSKICQILNRETYIGVEYYNMTYQLRDRTSGKVTVHHRPAEEWKRREMPHLRIISDELWTRVKARQKEIGEAFDLKCETTNARPRVELYPTTLFRPVCGACKTPLSLGRAGKYASFCCKNGLEHKHDCPLRTYKSVRIVEKAILGHLRETIFTAEFVAQVVEQANQFLRELAEQPQTDLVPLQEELDSSRAQHKKLVNILDSFGDDQLQGVVEKIRKLEQRIGELKEELAMAQADRAAVPPIELSAALELLEDLPGLLNDDVERAAPILAELTGPIEVQQTDRKRVQGTAWTAHFAPNLTPVLVALAAQRNCPNSTTWAYLNDRKWTLPEEVQVEIDKVPQYERLAPAFRELHAAGKSRNEIAAIHGLAPAQAWVIMNFALDNKRPQSVVKARLAKPKPMALYRQIAERVVELREGKNQSFEQIARENKWGEDTVRNAYDFLRPKNRGKKNDSAK